MKTLIAIFILFPWIVSAQNIPDDYAIYSQFLKTYQEQRSSQMYFVIRKSTEYGRKFEKDGITSIAPDFRGYLKGKDYAIASMQIVYHFGDKLKTDTLWIPLIEELGKKMKQEFIIKNNFSPDLQTVVINTHTYKKYFGRNKDVEGNWEHFYSHYPKSAILAEFSSIVSDGKRAVFYFADRRGGFGGAGQLVLFYREGPEWKFFSYISLWLS
jgi:hypothetical protein